MINLPNRREEFSYLDRRTWQLWAVCFSITFSLALGMAVFFFPVIRYHLGRLEIYQGILPQLVLGLLALVVLCVIYIIGEQRQLNELRDFIISLNSGAGLAEEDWPRDPLTGAIDRRALPEVMQREVSWVERYRTPLSLVLTNILAFRGVNERVGNLEADYVLKDLGQILQMTCRRSDTILRYGPDRFLCFLPRTDTVGAKVFCERVREATKRFPRFHSISLAFGVVLHNAGDSADTLLSQAETALANSDPSWGRADSQEKAATRRA